MLSTPSFAVDVLPTMQDIERGLRQFSCNKAPGPDGLIAEMYQIDIPIMARALHPLALKVAIRCKEAMRFKGAN